MTVKVNELAKELNMEATELLDRIRGMGSRRIRNELR